MFSVSPPSLAVREMLRLKGIDHSVVNLPPGTHGGLLRFAGFRERTVPALLIDGRRIQRSREISRLLDDLRPEPALFPSANRGAVEEAERWGDEVFQDVPRRIFRWAAAHGQPVRRWLGAEVARIPAPGLVGALNVPIARRFARASGADADAVRADLENLPSHLDRIEALIEEGTIGGERPNAADFQIASSVRALMGFEETHGLLPGRPAGELALRLFPAFPGPLELGLPREWLSAAR